MDYNTLSIFFATSLLLAIAPGPDNIFVLTQSIVFGRKAGIIVTLGLATGLVFHTIIVTLGISTIFQTSIVAFNVLKYIGASYLLFLAWKSFKASSSKIDISKRKKLSSWQLYSRGIIMNIINPKISIFFLAFLPQFTNSAKGSISLQLIVLGIIFILATLIVFSLVAQMSGVIGYWISKSKKGEVLINRVTTMIFISLALKIFYSNKCCPQLRYLKNIH